MAVSTGASFGSGIFSGGVDDVNGGEYRLPESVHAGGLCGWLCVVDLVVWARDGAKSDVKSSASTGSRVKIFHQ